MSSTLTERPLLKTCHHQQGVILKLIQQLTGIEEPQLPSKNRLQIIQHLRQKLSRHVQMMRHAVYPSLHKSISTQPTLTDQVTHIEKATAALVPQVTEFLYRVELSPEQSCQSEANTINELLKSYFEKETLQLYPIYIQNVPVDREERHFHLFQKRLKVTVNNYKTAASPAKTIPDPYPTAEDLDREAITRPILPGETLSFAPRTPAMSQG
jgi:hypothetical protein